MQLSQDLIVKGETVDFPGRCVVCGEDAAGEVVVLRGNPVGFNGVIPWIFQQTRRLKVPAHARCGKRLASSILWRTILPLVLVTLVVVVGVVREMPIGWVIGLGLVLMGVPIVWQVLRPVAFEFTHHRDRFKLMFADEGYAREVAEKNEGKVVEADWLDPEAGE